MPSRCWDAVLPGPARTLERQYPASHGVNGAQEAFEWGMGEGVEEAGWGGVREKPLEPLLSLRNKTKKSPRILSLSQGNH